MPTQPVPFQTGQETSFDELGGASPIALNVFVDGKGVIRRRPGITMGDQVDTDGIIGVYVVQNGSRYAVGNNTGGRKIYRVLGGAWNILDRMQGTLRPVFAETESHLVIAAGTFIQWVEYVTDVSRVLSAEAPIASHVISNSSRVLANDLQMDRNTVRYSDVVGSTSGATSGFGYQHWLPGDIYANPLGGPIPIYSDAGVFTAEAKPDWVVGLAEDSAEVYVFGREILEIWGPDPNLGYSRVTSREYGCSAPYSVVRLDAMFAWIDHARRVVVGDGRTMKVVSDPVKKILDSMGDISDAYGFRVLTGPFDAAVWVFPSDGRTLCYQPNRGWCQWSGWKNGALAPLKISARAFDSTTARDVVGTTDGYVAELSLDVATDGIDPIPASITTGFQDRGTSKRKQCLGVRVVLRRGECLEPGVVATLRYRDDLGPWSDPLEIALGMTGDTNPMVPFRGLGYYRSRQWKFDFTGTENLSLVDITEDFEELEM